MSLGGTLLEVAAHQDHVGELRDWALEVGITHIEVSNGLRALPDSRKHALIRELAADFVVLAETGAKEGNYPPTPAEWAEEMARDLDAGASWVIAEGRESGTVGLYHADQGVREDLVTAILELDPAGQGHLRGAGQEPAGLVRAAARRRRQPGQRRAGQRAGPGNPAARAARGHRRGRRADVTAEPRIAEPAPNTITRPYRGLSVQDVDVPLTPAAIEDLLRGREIYRRTAYLVLRRGGETALVAVRPARPRTAVLPGGRAARAVRPGDHGLDRRTRRPTSATPPRWPRPRCTPPRRVPGRDGVLAYVVLGRFEHVNFIWRPAPLPVRVTEVIPPHPPKLLAMAEQVVGFDEDLPPVDLALDAVDVRDLVAAHPAAHYLLPCRGSGAAGRPAGQLPGQPPALPPGLAADRLRAVPPVPRALLRNADPTGSICARGPGPPGLETPRAHQVLPAGTRHRGERSTAVVPWGANLDEVRAALRALCGLPPVPPGAGS